MERQIDIEEVSDGKRYGLNDMVKVGCEGCLGCSACCRGMGTSVVLDPFDIYRLEIGLKCSFEQLLDGRLELNVVDGIILPNLLMTGEGENCTFLNEKGRCTVHEIRPGFCRMFPLGRIYENRTFQYFLQVNECGKEHKTKIKVRKWLDTPRIQEYEAFVADWHYFLKDLQGLTINAGKAGLDREVSMFVLRQFFVEPYSADADFGLQFAERRAEGQKYLAALKQQLA